MSRKCIQGTGETMLEKTDFRSKFAQDLYTRYFGGPESDTPESHGSLSIEDSVPDNLEEIVQSPIQESYRSIDTKRSINTKTIIDINVPDIVIPNDVIKNSHITGTSDLGNGFDQAMHHVYSPRESRTKSFGLSRNAGYVSLQEAAALVNHMGVVGEEKLIGILFLAMANHMSCIVEGYSGSGKTYVTDNVLGFIPKKDVYRMELSSKMAAFYDAQRMNEANLIYVPELQKALNDKKSPITEMVKNITEGRDSIRMTTNDMRNGTDTTIVTKDKHFICTLAIENYFKTDAELSRRFLRLRTDDSPEHIQEIHDYKAKKRMLIDSDQEYYTGLEERLIHHIKSVRGMTELQILDPFASYIQGFMPKTKKSVSYIDHYYGLVDASAKFHYRDRESIILNNKEHLITSLEDHYLVHALYFNQFQDTLLSFQGDDAIRSNPAALQRVIDWKSCFIQGYEALCGLPSTYTDIIERWKNRQIDGHDGHALIVNSFPDGKRSILADIGKDFR